MCADVYFPFFCFFWKKLYRTFRKGRNWTSRIHRRRRRWRRGPAATLPGQHHRLTRRDRCRTGGECTFASAAKCGITSAPSIATGLGTNLRPKFPRNCTICCVHASTAATWRWARWTMGATVRAMWYSSRFFDENSPRIGNLQWCRDGNGLGPILGDDSADGAVFTSRSIFPFLND